MTDGMLWFKDLTAPDPTGIMPILGGVVTLLNIMTSSTSTTSVTARKMRKFFYFLPLISVPIWMTFPAVSINISLTFAIGFQSLLVNIWRLPAPSN